MRRPGDDPGLVPYTAVLLRDMVGTPEMRRIWTEASMVQGWMDVERAITAAQAELGMIPKRAAKAIVDRLTLRKLTLARIDAKRRTVGHLMVAFLKAFRTVCGRAAEHFHVGPTTQDILDTGLTLQMRHAHRLIMQQMLALETVLCARALEHQNTVVMGRNLSTWQRTEVMEVQEPYDDERYSSSTMPNKVNPESSEQLEGLAALVGGHALAMLDIRMLDNRDAIRIPVEYAAIPSAYLLAARALATMTTNIAGLVVHVDRMRANLMHPNDLGQAAAERLMIAMYRKTGERDRAQAWRILQGGGTGGAQGRTSLYA